MTCHSCGKSATRLVHGRCESCASFTTVHAYVAERAGWRTCAVCGRGANASIHKRVPTCEQCGQRPADPRGYEVVGDTPTCLPCLKSAHSHGGPYHEDEHVHGGSDCPYTWTDVETDALCAYLKGH